MSDQTRGDILEKISTGIGGFDDITAGGLPSRRTTLLMGGPGCGKVVLALQIHFPESHRIELIDILKDPMRTLADAILVAPPVVKFSPEPEPQIIGDLSEEEKVLRALGLPQKRSE